MTLLICIIGGSGSGKSTLANNIIINDGFSKIISTTTRCKREGEQNGREYHFVDTDTFKSLIDNNKLIEYVEFNDNYYGLTKTEFINKKDHLIFVVEPQGYMNVAKYILEQKIDLIPIVIYMDINEKERFKNMIKRGDNPIQIQERLKKDTITFDFKKFNIVADITVSKLHNTISKPIIDDIYEIIASL